MAQVKSLDLLDMAFKPQSPGRRPGHRGRFRSFPRCLRRRSGDRCPIPSGSGSMLSAPFDMWFRAGGSLDVHTQYCGAGASLDGHVECCGAGALDSHLECCGLRFGTHLSLRWRWKQCKEVEDGSRRSFVQCERLQEHSYRRCEHLHIHGDDARFL